MTWSSKNACSSASTFFGIAFVEQHAQIALRREHEQLVGVHQRAPQIAGAVERDAVRPRAFAQARRPEDLAVAEIALLVDAQPRDAAAGRFDDVQELFVRIEPDFVGEVEAVGDDAEFAVFVARDVAVRRDRCAARASSS